MWKKIISSTSPKNKEFQEFVCSAAYDAFNFHLYDHVHDEAILYDFRKEGHQFRGTIDNNILNMNVQFLGNDGRGSFMNYKSIANKKVESWQEIKEIADLYLENLIFQ